MKSSIITKEKVRIDAANEIMGLGLKTGAVICALIGVWALCSMAAAVIQTGPLTMLRGYITAITGI
jgi:hypothetical protein